jgi:hypothetical protein
MKKMLMFLAVCLIVPGLLLLSVEKPKVKKGAELTMVSGTLVQWKDIEKVDFTKHPEKRVMKAVMNFENPRKIVKKSTAADPVVQTGLNRNGQEVDRGSLAIPTPIIHFAGMNLNANGAGWPPDTNGDVGMNYYVQVVNTSIGIYNKATGAVVSTTTFNSFFPSSVGSPCDANNQGDPVVHYDPYNQRWILYDFAWSGTSNGSFYSIAASKTSDPTGAWWTYCLHADNTLMNDYPKSGVWHDGIYVTANMFSFASGQFQHVKVWVLKSPDIYNGTLSVQSLTDASYQAWSILPSNAKGTTPPSAGTPNYMFAIDADEYGGSSIDAIYWWKLSVDWNTPANTTWSGAYTMPTAAFGLTASRIPQPGTSVQLDSLYGRPMYPAIYRKAPTEAVYLNHVCEYNSTRTTRWYEIRISGGNCSIYQQGTYAPDSTHRWMGGIAGDKNGGIALGFSASSSSVYPSIRYAGRLVGDPLNQLSQGEATMVAGTGSQTGYTRWGDYSGITLDPADDETFWYTTEYYTSTGTNWQTRIGAFKLSSGPPPTPPAAPTNLSATVQNCNINLSWTDNANNEDGFKIERSLNGTSFSQIATVGANVTTYNDGSVTDQTQYWYRVRAYNAGGNSAYSNTATATAQCAGTAPAAPTITSTSSTRDSVTLNWTDNSNNEDGFKIYRGLSSGSLSLVATVSANTTTYTDTGLARRTTYYYKVCAYNAYGESCSAVVSKKTR